MGKLDCPNKTDLSTYLRVKIHLATSDQQLATDGRLATEIELEVVGDHCYTLKSLNVSYLTTKDSFAADSSR